ncbi:MAG: hypothetical protein RLZZ546_2536 [Bacteroidota bacterium]|jgi:hypothetical protein
MNKLIATVITFASSAALLAQDSAPKTPLAPQLSYGNEIQDSSYNVHLIQTLVPLFTISLVVFLIIQVIRFILDYRLKNKIIDRGISEQLANSILQKSDTNKKDDSIKWASLLLCLSGGLTATYYAMPLNVHSLAIIAFSIGLSYLVYFFYLNKKNI